MLALCLSLIISISVAAVENFGDRQASIELTGIVDPEPMPGTDFEATEDSISMNIPGRDISILTSKSK